MAKDVQGALQLLTACAAPKPDLLYHPSGGAGGPGCQALLGGIYLEGDGGVPVDLKAGADWLQRAAEQHMPKAESHLADLYESGKGVKQDSAKAAYWRQRASADADIEPGHWTPL
jgi:TPR repeat protein